MWIQNVSTKNIEDGRHSWDENTILIQIVDPDMEFPTPARQFQEIHQFKFLDLEADSVRDDMKISDHAAAQIVSILQSALDTKNNVVVHCVAGVCRSGAVCEVGVMMGFDDTGAYRHANTLVKYKLMRVLGWTYD